VPQVTLGVVVTPGVVVMVPVLVLVCATVTVGMHRLARDKTNALTLIACSCSRIDVLL
jgi:hypothetical protein